MTEVAIHAWNARASGRHRFTERAETVAASISERLAAGCRITLDIDRPHEIMSARAEAGVVYLMLACGRALRLGGCYSLTTTRS